MRTEISELRWHQNGVERIVKLLPGGRIGFLSEPIRRETELQGDALRDMLREKLSGDPVAGRTAKAPEGLGLATICLDEWELEIEGEHGLIPMTICRPVNAKEGIPCVLYVHGGGWRTGSRAAVQPVCRYLAETTEALVINVEYRLAPEHKWPAGFEDCWAALCWAYENAESIGADKLKIFVSGDSAGGNLAALCTHRDRDQGTRMVKAQALYYPALAVGETEGLKDFRFSADDYLYDDSQREVIEPRIMALWDALQSGNRDYLPADVDSRKPSVSPMWDVSFTSLPPTLLITAQYDALTAQSRAYAKYLAESGVKVTWIDYCGMTHGFIGRYVTCPEVADSVREIAEFFRRNI